MTEKRYYAHKNLLQENQVHDTICHNFMNIDETVEHMNNQYWKYKQLKEENEQLKQQKIDLLRLIENNIEIYENINTNVEFHKGEIQGKLTVLNNLRKVILND